MSKLSLPGLAVSLLVGAATPAVAAQPGSEFSPLSTPAAVCGTQTPPPGTLPPELRAGPEGLTLTVKQDGKRLCYVALDGTIDPTIRVRQGDDLTITLRNEIDDPAAIDSVVSPGKLQTPNPAIPETPGFYPVIPGMRHEATGATNLHVHGFAVPPVAPQDEVLRTCIDPAVGPARCGRREFTYRYHVPKDMPAGLYWYHPHVHGEVQAQMLMGLSGAIVVEGAADDARRAAGIGERLLIVRQTQDLDAGKNQAAGPPAVAPPTHAPVPGTPRTAGTQIDTTHELLCSPSANFDEISLNGTPVLAGDTPDEALTPIRIPEGGRQFWRVLNAATDAFLDLVLVDEKGGRLPVQVVARDGVPLAGDSGKPLASSPTTEPQPVPPAGRLEVLVPAPPPGAKAYLITRAIDTGCAGDRLPQRRLAVVTAGPADPTASSASTPAPAAPDLFDGLLAARAERTRTIAFAEYPRPGSEDQTDFYIVERRPGAVLRPYMMGDPPAIAVEAGTTEEWVVENWTHELHAFHIHQVHFRVLEVDGKPVADPPLLDTVTVPFATATGFHSKEGPVRPGRVRIKLGFPEALAGDIPFHCHLTDHEDNGMMAVLRVLPAHPQKAALPDGPAPICRPRT
jgi:FtsP/CotA-like multicopper oxidase with cupredoxin domain